MAAAGACAPVVACVFSFSVAPSSGFVSSVDMRTPWAPLYFRHATHARRRADPIFDATDRCVCGRRGHTQGASKLLALSWVIVGGFEGGGGM
jgi:hypothetical protein